MQGSGPSKWGASGTKIHIIVLYIRIEYIEYKVKKVKTEYLLYFGTYGTSGLFPYKLNSSVGGLAGGELQERLPLGT